MDTNKGTVYRTDEKHVKKVYKEGKVVPLRSIEALWVTGGIAPTLS
jgi:hypothetical protein